MFQRCLVGRLGYDFQTANAGCMWCAGPSWLLGISFTPKIGMEAAWNSSSQRNLPTFQNFTASCPIPRRRILGKPFLCFFLTLGVHRELWRDRSLDYFRDEQTQLHGGWSWTQWALEIPLHQELLIAATATGFRTHPAGLNVGTDIAPKLYTICCW